jgi:Xaa-Pro dipeptidase
VATKEKHIFSSMKADVDCIVLMNAVEPNLDHTFFYATGIPNGLFEGCVAIVSPSKVEVLSSDLEALSSRQAGVRTTVFKGDADRTRILGKRLAGAKRIGINPQELTVANYRLIRKAVSGAKLVDVSADLARARMRKQPDEITKIRKACQIASRAGETIPDLVREGMSETEGAAELDYMMMKLGASAPAFGTVVAFGPSAAEPHYAPMSKRLRKGQFALFDFGAAHKRYVSDMTRTFVCSSPNARQKEMYEVVLEAQQAALDTVSGGVSGKEVDKAARDIIDRSRFKGRFIHGTGHGLGVTVHDPGSISPSRDMTLEEGMVLTVEPGVYIKGFGGVRIEDDILVTKKGCRVLTSCTKEFRSL